MFKKLSILAAILFVSACATQPQADSTDSSGQEVASEDTNDRDIICKRTQKVGTHFKTKQCWTKEDYEDLQRKSKDAVERAQGSSMTAPESR